MLDQEPLRPVPPPVPPPAPTEPVDPAQAFGPVRALLERARARQRRHLVFQGLFAAAAVLFLLTPVVLALAASNHFGGLAALLALALAVSAFTFFGVIRARRDVGDASATAHLIAERVGEEKLKRGLVPAVELSRELEKGSALGYSEALARAHIASVAAEVKAVDLEKVLPDTQVRRFSYVALGTGVLFVALTLFLGATLSRGLKALFSAPLSGAAALVAAEPITGDIELTLVYPAYTHLATRTIPNTNGEISAPRGTEVRLKTRADREVEKAFVVIGDHAQALAVDGKRDLAGSFIVQAPGSYKFRFASGHGRTVAEGPPIPIAVEADNAPKVSITSPITDIEVDPKSRVPVRFEAEDDYGLSEVALVFKLPGGAKPQRVILKRGGDGRRASGEYEWDIAGQGLMAGDKVAYYVEAADNDAVSGKKTGVSRTQYLKVYSEAEHHRQIIKLVQEKWEKLVVHLADRLEGPDHRAGEGRTMESVLGQEAVDKRGLALAMEFRDLSASLKKEKAPDALRRALANVAQGLTTAIVGTADARSYLVMWSKRGIGLDSPVMKRVEQAVNSEIAEEEKDVLYLETLLDHQRIEDLKALTRELSAKRRELSDLLEKYRTAPSDQIREQIERDIARLKERMAEIMQRMAELSKGINDEHVNAEALKEMQKEKSMMDSFDKIQELLHQGKVEEAMKELEKLGEQMDKLEKGLNKASGDFKGSDPELAKGLQDFAKGLDDLKQSQEDLLKETQEIRQNYKKSLDEQLEKKGKDFVDKLRQKVDAAKKKMAEVPPDQGYAVFGTDDLKAAKDAIDDLDRALAVKDFDQAEQRAQKALTHAQRVESELDRQVSDGQRYQTYDRPRLDQMKKRLQSTQGARQPIEEVKKELDQLFPSPEKTMSPEDRQRMQQQAQKQAQMQQQAEKLQQQMEQIGQKAPVFSPEAKQLMQGAGQKMGEAQGQLSQKNPTGAMAGQRAALDQLGQLKKGLEQQQQKGGGQGGGAPIPWPWMGQSPGSDPGDEGEDGNENNNDQKVVIPGADQYQVPEEYRKDILDAMKQRAPDKYKEQVKKYYEEIVK